MSLTTGTIHFTDKKDTYISNSLMRELNIDETKPIKLKLGEKRIKTKIKRVRKKGKHLFIPKSIQQALKLPRKGQSYISLNQDDEIELGPLIGILSLIHQRTLHLPFGKRTYRIKEYLKGGSNKAFYFAFGLSDINWTDETVTAYFIDSRNQWKKKVVPLPDVIYNQLKSRSSHKTKSMQMLLDHFKKHNKSIFNWGFFDKGEMYQLLDGTLEAQNHLPETHISTSSQEIKKMLEKHQFIYLKPTRGSFGRGISRITYHPKNGYFIRFRKINKNHLLRFTNFSSLMKFINQRKTHKNYVIQQGIRLIEIDKHPIDFRLHLNKNGQNEWVVAGDAAKKAGRGNVTTHVEMGGQVMNSLDTLEQVFTSSQSQEIYENAKRTTIQLAEAIERKLPYLVGELGFDIGIDKQGKIWMIEVNSKPGRSIFKHPSLKTQSSDQLRYIFDYCFYLSNQRNTRREVNRI
ncbi:YheC/YheD family endospore coat-associated protein [Chengkuizengella axinellae]|uniref:YheC/YheD family protein n=1 Tax=Chengkuizengella axinellae TaxID=3064388 RepID=A0ABT9IZ43_9BACL|nr:YheC/YheD family protein [Chengkuizengella sp. 2205SS18-9]MDP5274397.1 YheC/YheD family protein [Chengkuizengella sp. 2205SS18-9]